MLTRRSRSNNSLANNDDDTGSVVSARGSTRGGAPLLPPPPPPPPDPPQQHTRMTGRAAQLQRVDATGNNGGMMFPVPEEVAVNDNNDNNSGDSSEVSVVGNNNFVETNNNVTAQAPPPIRYLQVRVPSPSQLSSRRPSRIHRRHHHRPPPTNGPNNAPHNRSKIRGKSHSSSHSEGGEIVRVLVPPNGFASEQQLAACLSQAGAMDSDSQGDHPSSSWNNFGDDDFSLDEYFDDKSGSPYVAGMFCESNRVFVPLSVIYTNPASFVGDVLCLKRPSPKRPIQLTTGGKNQRRSIFITFLELIGIATIAAVSWWTYGAAQLVDWEFVSDEAVFKIEKYFFAVINFPFWLFDAVIEFPLREIYRHGPSILGWEGEPLPRICSRITYHGDESFWARNIEECEQIYRAKESAAMQVRKPIVICLLVLALFYMVRSIVAARALRRRERIDPNMVETYRAIQMITRQLKRAVNAR